MQRQQLEKALPYLILTGLAAAVLVLAACGSSDDPAKIPIDRDVPETFTFFDVGAATPFTDALAESLEGHLGSASLETRGTIDLTLTPRDLLENHFPGLYGLHRALNNEFRARVEHDISLLTFRYPWKKNTPFIFVRLVFSNRTGLPLYFRMTLNKEGDAVVATLKEKYGTPQPVAGGNAAGEIVYWENKGDYLVVSQRKNRLGEMEYDMMFYFTANLETLHNQEETEKAKKAEDLEKAGKTAF